MRHGVKSINICLTRFRNISSIIRIKNQPAGRRANNRLEKQENVRVHETLSNITSIKHNNWSHTWRCTCVYFSLHILTEIKMSSCHKKNIFYDDLQLSKTSKCRLEMVQNFVLWVNFAIHLVNKAESVDWTRRTRRAP